MTVRSLVHMLTVAAARLEHDHANPRLIADLRATAQRMAARKAEGRGYTDEDVARIKAQRDAFFRVKSVVDLKNMLLQRAYDLMWDGDCAGADAILEFLPEADVDEMFDSWERDQSGNAPFSRFYNPKAA